MLRSIASRLPSGPRLALPRRCLQQTLSLPRRGLSTTIDAIPKEPTDLDNITTLPNGIRVASEALLGSFSGVGVYIEGGSRYETPELSGVSHIMDRLAFKSTTRRSADDMIEQVEALGGNIQCASSREAMMYQAATFNSAVPTTVALLAETIRDPLITDAEVTEQLATAAYEIKEIWGKPELIMPELVHTAAFKNNTLGNPLLCPHGRLEEINANTIRAYRDTFYRPDRMVVAFAGVEHNEAVRLADQYFGDMPAAKSTLDDITGSETSASDSAPSSPSSTSSSTSSSSSSIFPFFNPFSKSKSASSTATASLSSDIFRPAEYTGGFLSLPPQPPSLNPAAPVFSHIHLAFEGLPISSEDIYALATLQTLLGGGGSFSAGGPGKGMYSRLYTNVLNQHGWVESCVAFNHSYTDSGLFGISASCIPGRTSKMLEVICRELHSLTLESGHSALKQVEVQRAKNQLRSSLLMNLESRMVELEDLGRQVQVHGRKIPVTEMCRRIESLTVEDLRRVARIVVGGLVENPGAGNGAPTVVLNEAQALGVSSHGLTWEAIQDKVYQWGLGRR